MTVRHFYSICILLLGSPTLGYSQKWEYRIGGGATIMTLPISYEYTHFGSSTQPETKLSPTLSGFLSVGRRVISERYAVGLRGTIASLRRIAISNYHTESKVYLYAGFPAVLLQPFISYRYKGFCGGLQAGLITYNGEGPHSLKYNRRVDGNYKLTCSPYIGFAGGMHIGYGSNLRKHFGVFADLSCNYISSSSSYDFAPPAAQRFFQPAGVIGIQYTRNGKAQHHK